MRRIGLLGGMSWESTAEYYRMLNEGVRARLGGLHSANCVLRSVDFAEIELLQREGRWQEAGGRLADEARTLVAAGAEMLVLCTNTMHKVADAIGSAVEIPLVHIADATAEAVQARGLRTVGLLATAYTMEQDFYTGRLRHSHGLQVLIPPERDRQLVHKVIYEELCLGTVNASSRDEYRRIIAELVQRGAEGILLGCTEIDLLISPEDAEVPTFDTTQLHVQKALEAALDSAQAKPIPLRLDHCVIAVSDWSRSNAFYRDVLGAAVIPHGAGCVYRFGDQQLNVHGPDVQVTEVAQRPVRPGGSDLCFAWEGTTETALEHLRAHGVTIETAPVRRHGARGTGQSIYFRDPDGSLLELICYSHNPDEHS